MAPPTTIIFGATGNVGSAAARTVQAAGGKVALAMRNTQKAIPNISSEEEKAGGYERVQADLTQPETLSAAVRKTGATRAFIYLATGASDHMRAALEALKSAGVTFVVFLSSASVRGDDLSQIPPSDFIPYAHGQVELVLADVFGPQGYIAVRPAYFNTNTSWWAPMIAQGELRMAYPDVKFDFIAPRDIGTVAGKLLTRGFAATEGSDKRNFVFLMGPKMLSQKEAALIIAKAVGKQGITVTEVDEEEGVQIMMQGHVPEPIARMLIKSMGEMSHRDTQGMFDPALYKEASANVVKYAGKATPLEQWAVENKAMFQV